MLALQADTHSIETDLSTLNRDCKPLEGLLERHITICLDLQFVAGLDYRVEQSRDDRLLVNSLNQIYRHKQVGENIKISKQPGQSSLIRVTAKLMI